MNPYEVRGTLEAEPPGPFVVGRAVRMNYRVVDVTDNAAEVGIDLTGGRWSVRVRAYSAPTSTSTLRDELCVASTANGDDGYFDHAFLCGATAYPAALRWEFVLIDASASDASSKSTKVEYVLLQFKASIESAPRA